MRLILALAVLAFGCTHHAPAPNGLAQPCEAMSKPDSGVVGVFCPTDRMEQIIERMSRAEERAAACSVAADGGSRAAE